MVPDGSTPSGGAARRVVVVDDNADAADALAMFLESFGAGVRIAYDGVEAVSVVEAFRPELVLLDLAMPGLDGYEVVRHIRGAAWGERIRIVAMTGWDRDEDRRRTREAGFDGHIVKPVTPRALERLLVRTTP